MLPAPERLLSCDWGTSSFRLRLVALPHLEVLATYNSEEGIAATWRAWQEKGGDRVSFYLDVVQRGLHDLAQSSRTGLEGIPLVLSGMATASIGMMELPYAALPFPMDGSAAMVQHLPASDAFPNPIWLVSGVRSDTDVMRGEEVQLLGAMEGAGGAHHFCIIPGTHSKHIELRQGLITRFSTFMTGEFFALLSQQSILSASVEIGGSWRNCPTAFAAGVAEGSKGNILQTSFSVRTSQLFGRWSKEENYHYLSGLLIGAELATLDKSQTSVLTLIGNTSQTEMYQFALETLFPKNTIRVVDGGTALVKGQAILLAQHTKKQAA